MRPILSLSTDTHRTTPIRGCSHEAISLAPLGRARSLPTPTTSSSLPEGAEPERWLSAVRFRMETPPGFPVRGTRARSQQSKEQGQTKSRLDAWDLPLQTRSGFSKARAVQPTRPRHYTTLYRFPQTLPQKPCKPQTAPRNSQGTSQPPHLRLLNPPQSVLPAPHRAPSIHRESEANREKMPSRGASLHTSALSLKQKRREEGDGKGGGRKVYKKDGESSKKELGRRVGVRRDPATKPAPTPRGRSLTCPGRCRC